MTRQVDTKTNTKNRKQNKSQATQKTQYKDLGDITKSPGLWGVNKKDSFRVHRGGPGDLRTGLRPLRPWWSGKKTTRPRGCWQKGRGRDQECWMDYWCWHKGCRLDCWCWDLGCWLDGRRRARECRMGDQHRNLICQLRFLMPLPPRAADGQDSRCGGSQKDQRFLQERGAKGSVPGQASSVLPLEGDWRRLPSRGRGGRWPPSRETTPRTRSSGIGGKKGRGQRVSEFFISYGIRGFARQLLNVSFNSAPLNPEPSRNSNANWMPWGWGPLSAGSSVGWLVLSRLSGTWQDTELTWLEVCTKTYLVFYAPCESHRSLCTYLESVHCPVLPFLSIIHWIPFFVPPCG